MRAFFAAAMLLLVTPAFAESDVTDLWAPVRALEGKWQGQSKGEPGEGVSTREYKFILDGKFLHGETTTVYPPQAKNKNGETHRDIAVFSADRRAQGLTLRQFHSEGFVNTYAEEKADGTVRFVTTSIENIPTGFRARETYVFKSADEVVETFEIAPPGKEFSVYSDTRLKRVK